MLNANLSYKYNNILKFPAQEQSTGLYTLTQNYDRTSTIKASSWLTAFGCNGVVDIRKVTKSYFDKADKKTLSQEFIVLTINLPQKIEEEFNTTIPEIKLIEVRDGYDIKFRYSGSRIYKSVLTRDFISWAVSINLLKANHDLNLLQNK